jgi:hypothetical protein
MAILPSGTSPVLEGEVFSPPWYRFFSDLIGGPDPIKPVVATGSPFIFSAPRRGFLQITGGVSLGVTITRGRVSISAGILTGFIPVSAGDAIRITYSSTPTLYFLAS